jgi:hypothetical protein
MGGFGECDSPAHLGIPSDSRCHEVAVVGWIRRHPHRVASAVRPAGESADIEHGFDAVSARLLYGDVERLRPCVGGVIRRSRVCRPGRCDAGPGKRRHPHPYAQRSELGENPSPTGRGRVIGNALRWRRRSRPLRPGTCRSGSRRREDPGHRKNHCAEGNAAAARNHAKEATDPAHELLHRLGRGRVRTPLLEHVAFKVVSRLRIDSCNHCGEKAHHCLEPTAGGKGETEMKSLRPGTAPVTALALVGLTAGRRARRSYELFGGSERRHGRTTRRPRRPDLHSD